MSVATEISRLSAAKADIKRAINAKGGTLVNERLSEYASAIDNLLPEDFRNRGEFRKVFLCRTILFVNFEIS